MNKFKIDGRPDLQRDGHSNAVVNTDVRAFELARLRHTAQSAQEARLQSLENDIRDIKALLLSFVHQGKSPQ